MFCISFAFLYAILSNIAFIVFSHWPYKKGIVAVFIYNKDTNTKAYKDDIFNILNSSINMQSVVLVTVIVVLFKDQYNTKCQILTKLFCYKFT